MALPNFWINLNALTLNVCMVPHLLCSVSNFYKGWGSKNVSRLKYGSLLIFLSVNFKVCWQIPWALFILFKNMSLIFVIASKLSEIFGPSPGSALKSSIVKLEIFENWNFHFDCFFGSCLWATWAQNPYCLKEESLMVIFKKIRSLAPRFLILWASENFWSKKYEVSKLLASKNCDQPEIALDFLGAIKSGQWGLET
mgnify:CR=1 FL=1